MGKEMKLWSKYTLKYYLQQNRTNTRTSNLIDQCQRHAILKKPYTKRNGFVLIVTASRSVVARC